MTHYELISKNFIHYLRANLLVAIGVAISTAVLTGALIIGDSVTFSLERSAFYRLGTTTHLVSTADRYFRTNLGHEIAAKGGFDVAPVFILEGMAVADGGNERVNKLQIIGVDNYFEKIAKSPIYQNLTGDQVIISANLAGRLHLKEGDRFIARIKRASLMPLNTPFISDAETSVSFRAFVKKIADQHNMGFFNLKNSQTAPYNLFLSLEKLNQLMKFSGKANRLLIAAPSSNEEQITNLLDACFTTEDAGLKVKKIPLTHETAITSDRIFIDNQIVKAFEPIKDAHPILTYFANSLNFNGRSTPYSFVSTINDSSLNNNDIIINEWVASDLKAMAGDSITLKYFEIGPLRQLIEKSVRFVIKKIVPIEGKYADQDLMPAIPGLSDAGHCRDWETGVPIRLESIRSKDETYWNQYKGTPKAFISLKRAHQLWTNRFGNNTAIRISDQDFSDKTYRSLFSASVKPANLGILVTAVRDNGLKAARNGVDFSQLFIGLSFFLLVAALMLTSLLFLLNLESRQSELGTLKILGFSRNQIRKILLSEGLIIAFAGAITGLIMGVIYTKLIFLALNTLWWDVVRTSVLMIEIKTSTLLMGLVISIFMALITILIAVHRNFKREAIVLQRQQDQVQKPFVKVIKVGLMIITLISAVGLVIFQLITSSQINSSLFFLSGGLMLIGLLFLADFIFRLNRRKHAVNFSLRALNERNRSQNMGRSLTVVILFALGTFLVVSTGANRIDSLSDSANRSSGTGGYHFFAETSVPVLFSLNDPDRRLKEGLTTPFKAAQFGRIDGDDASCLNLNRATNPAILGTDPLIFKDRFTFDTRCPEIQNKTICEALNKQSDNKVVPAIADQTVIQWGLGLNVGDTLTYRNEKGELLRLKLIAGLAPSVFQGYVLISNTNFLKNFPSSSGSHLFLIDVPKENAAKAGEELQNVFRDYGWGMTTAPERLMEFNSVTNTYLSIFLMLGTLGLILGTVGLAIVLARSILERGKEVALMQSLGYTRNQLAGLLVGEYTVLLVWGVVIGTVSAVVAVLPNFLSPGNGVSFGTVILIVMAIVANGLIWIATLAWLGLRQKRLIGYLAS